MVVVMMMMMMFSKIGVDDMHAQSIENWFFISANSLNIQQDCFKLNICQDCYDHERVRSVRYHPRKKYWKNTTQNKYTLQKAIWEHFFSICKKNNNNDHDISSVGRLSNSYEQQQLRTTDIMFSCLRYIHLLFIVYTYKTYFITIMKKALHT